MARIGLIGPSYSSQSLIADCQRTMNWYPETVESGQGTSALALYPTPGLSLFCALPAGPVRGEFAINGRIFAVGGGNLYELTNVVYQKGIAISATATFCGIVGNDFLPVTMATNGSAGNQLAICSAGKIYVFYLAAASNVAAGTLVGPVAGLQGQASQLVFCNGYFLATLKISNKFQVSNPEDATNWNALGITQIQEFPENIGAMGTAFQQVFFMGANGHTQVYYDSGASAYTPFSAIGGAFMEEGISAPLSLCILDNTPFWIGGNVNGVGIGWRASGYTPLRITNHAIETAWANYPSKGTDAVGFSYRDQGHTFWVLRFPSANNGFGATWVYDVATQMWHERGTWTATAGYTGYSAHLAGCHAFCFNQHLVGDWNSGNIYAMSIGTYTDNGLPIRRSRRAPHVSSEEQWIYHHELQIKMQVGLGPQPPLVDGAGNPRDPQIMLRWSNDGGETWGNEHWMGVGQTGKYKNRVRWQRLGRARDRVYEFAVTDAIPWRIVEGYLRADPGFQMPTERYSKQMAKIT